MKKRIIKLKFVGIDDWNRPIFKQENKKAYFGMTDHLFNYNDDWERVKDRIKEIMETDVRHLEYFGAKFGCEPKGGFSENWEYQIEGLNN